MALTESPKTPDKPAEPKPAAKAGPLARASESGDPTVHQAMAVLDGALMNRAALDVEAADVKKADEQVEAARKALAELGFS